MATVESRIKVASDIIALRLQRKISIRLSATRESDRFSRVQFGWLAGWQAGWQAGWLAGCLLTTSSQMGVSV